MEARELGAFIADLRKEKGMTQEELAQKLHVTKSAVSKWERGAGLPDIQMIEPLAENLQVSIAEIIKSKKMTREELLETNAGELLKELTAQFQKEKRMAVTEWLSLAGVIVFALWLPSYLWRDVRELGGGTFTTMLLLATAFTLPLLGLGMKRYAHLFSFGSYFCSILVCANEFFFIDHKIALEDWSALMDTAGLGLVICRKVLIPIFLLNAAVYFFAERKNRRALVQLFMELWQKISGGVLWIMGKF